MKRSGIKRRPTRPKKGANPGHLAKVRKLPCCSCGRPGPSHAHHQHGEPGTLKGMGLKAPDETAVPLCAGCHNSWHAVGHFPGCTRDASIKIMQNARAELGGAERT